MFHHPKDSGARHRIRKWRMFGLVEFLFYTIDRYTDRPQYAQSCTGTLRSRHFQLIFSGKRKTTTHITIGKYMTIQFTTWF